MNNWKKLEVISQRLQAVKILLDFVSSQNDAELALDCKSLKAQLEKDFNHHLEALVTLVDSEDENE